MLGPRTGSKVGARPLFDACSAVLKGGCLPDKRNGARMPARALARWLPSALPRTPNRVPSLTSHIAFLVALALIAAIAFLLFPARRVAVVADGVERTVVSHQRSDAAVVRQAGLALSPGDAVVWQETPDGRPVLAVQRATPVIAEVDGRLVYWRTRADTVEGALAEIGVSKRRWGQSLHQRSPRRPLGIAHAEPGADGEQRAGSRRGSEGRASRPAATSYDHRAPGGALHRG